MAVQATSEVVSLIRIKDLSLSFREKVVLNGIDWLIAEGSRIGLVGDNGVGKTTFLRLLAGEIVPDEGRVEWIGDPVVGYLPQDLIELGDDVVMDFLRKKAGLSSLSERLAEAERRISECEPGSRELARALFEHEELERDFSHRDGYAFEATASRVLRGLGFAPGDVSRRCTEFSGGWRMRLALASILLLRPDVLLLDEPTNHLDTESMEWLESWLRDHKGVMIFVSHDRRFLGKMATEIAELVRGEFTRYAMGYERYVVEREAARERKERAIEDQRERIERMQRFIERFRYKSSKASQVQSRIRQLEKMEIYETDSPARSVDIRFPEASRSGWAVLSARGLAKRYGTIEVFSGLALEINRGQRVALVGVNGAGKSTLLRLLSGEEAPDAGTVSLGHNVRQAYFSQESALNLNYSHTVWEEACRTGSALTETEKRNLLGSFLFSGDDVQKPIRVLSGGEKSRVALFKLLLSDSNFLILDEPTNHLDMKTRELFQQALLRYGGTLLIVSHDRSFLDDLVERVLEIRDGTLYDYSGNYSRFIEKREEMWAKERGEMGPLDRGIAEAHDESAPSDARERRRQEAKERNRLYRERKVYTDKLEPLEKRIEERESRRAEIDGKLCSPEVLADSSLVQRLMIERKSLDDALAADYETWEALTSALEAIG